MEPIHTFVVLAYQESEYLENSIQSVLNQEYPSKVVIGTSTDNVFIRNLANKYHLEVIVNPISGGGNKGDFDFAWNAGKNTIVTIAHQDDQYDPSYSRKIVEAYQKYPDSTLLFTDYYEIRNGERVYDNKLLKVKRWMMKPLRKRESSSDIRIKHDILKWGDAICCPAVSYIPGNIPFKTIFQQDYFKGVADWYGWYKVSNEKGAFTYISEPLMGHRVHEESHTSREINSDIRSAQELEMFKNFWPTWIAKIINHFYRSAQKSNTVKK